MNRFRPPENITVSEWADKYRMLSTEASAEPGRWKTSRTPYLREIMDSFTDDRIQKIVFVSASQVGKTEAENNILSYLIDQDPGPVLFVQPTENDCKRFSTQRLAPMIRDTKCISDKFGKAVSRDSRNTIMQKQFPGGMLTLVGTNAPSSLASMPIRYVLGDELDRWANSAGTEGDPLGLAEARQTTFYNRKSVFVSTPTIKGASRIADQYETGTQERWCTQCPDCGEWSEITFKRLDFHYDTIGKKKKTYTVDKDVYWTCPNCGVAHLERDAKQYPHKWIATNPKAYENGVRSFWLNAFASPWKSWQAICLAFLQAKDDPKSLQVVVNTLFGELWEARGDLVTEDEMINRREDYGMNTDGTAVEVPDGVIYLTCGVDTQDTRLEYEVKGWGHSGETWGIRKGVIMGRPDTPEVWAKLDDIVDHVYYGKDRKTGFKIRLTFVDSGGHFTQEVYENCRARKSKNVFPIKGKGGQDVPFVRPPSQVAIKDSKVRKVWLYTIGVDAGKTMIYKNLEVETPGPYCCHYPMNPEAGYDAAYFTGLLSETLEVDKTKKMVWKILPGHKRNEPLDLHNYNLAASKLLNIDTRAEETRLKMQENGQKKPVKEAARPIKQTSKTRERRRIRNDDW